MISSRLNLIELYDRISDFTGVKLQDFKRIELIKPGFHNLNNTCLLLIGETGAGKTSFAKLLVNYLHHNNYNYDLYNQEIYLDYERNGKDPCEPNEFNIYSSTKYSTLYQLKQGDDIFRIIDTPGLNDTHGFKNDKENLDSIYNKLKELPEGVRISNILFFYNGKSDRIVDLIDYVYESFKIFFPTKTVITFISTKISNKEMCKRIPDFEVYIIDNPLVLFKEKCYLEQCRRNYIMKYRNDHNTVPNNGLIKQYNREIKQLELKLETGQELFDNILYKLFDRNLNIDVIKIITNYKSYLDIELELNQLKNKFNIISMELGEWESYGTLISITKKLNEFVLYFDSIKEVMFKEDDIDDDLSDHISFCVQCLVIANKVYTDNNVVFIHQSNCEHSSICYLLEEDREKFTHFNDLHQDLMIEIKRHNNLCMNMITNINLIDEIINNGVLRKLDEMIDSFQRESMINDLNSFFRKQLELLNKIKSKNIDDKYLIGIIEILEKTYLDILNIRSKGFYDLKQKYEFINIKTIKNTGIIDLLDFLGFKSKETIKHEMLNRKERRQIEKSIKPRKTKIKAGRRR